MNLIYNLFESRVFCQPRCEKQSTFSHDFDVFEASGSKEDSFAVT